MPIDGLTLGLVASELKKEITGYRIDKIHQPSVDEIIFTLRSRSGQKKLYISASAGIPRINLTETSPENPAVPPMLCMFMRKHLTGCTITDIIQEGSDRIIYILLSGFNEIGDPVDFKIVFEAIVKHSNFIILNNDGIILEAVKKNDFNPATGRSVLPGFKYVLPPKPVKLNLINDETDSIVNRVLSEGNKLLSSALLNNIEGLSPLISREISCLVTGNDEQVSALNDIHIGKLRNTVESFKNIVISSGSPVMLYNDEKPFDITFTDITQYGFSVKPVVYPSYSALIDSFYSERNKINRIKQQSSDLQKSVSNLISRAARKLDTRLKELSDCKDKDKFRVYAELILANQYSLEKGSLYYDVPDYYNNYENVRIKADPSLDPAGNARKYFKEYNKLKNAEKLLDNLIKESEIETEYLNNVLDAIKRAESVSDITEIKQELYDQGYLKRIKQAKGKRPKPLPPVEYVSDDGYTILVGRNNIQNENLTFKMSAKDDSWFHTQKYPGSHVVVVGNGDILPELTCRQAAVIAATNSSAEESSRVAVDYTEVRELKKVPGGKPGMVIYHKYNTMWVVPDKELCDRLRKDR